MNESETPVTNARGDVLCPNCRRFIPTEYDSDFCVFGRHPRKKQDGKASTTNGGGDSHRPVESQRMKRRIHGMTSGQTTRVCDVVVRLTREWLLEHGAIDGRYGGAAALADLNRDCYIGCVQMSYSTHDGRAVSGELIWRLDYTFAPIGEPDVRLAHEEDDSASG